MEGIKRSSNSKLAASYKQSILDVLKADVAVHLFWKGRVGLYAFLKAVGVGSGDEVITPAFTCVVVPNAVIYLGAKPVYVDIDCKTYNAKPWAMLSAITPKTKVLICQSTFGLSTDLKEITTEANARGVVTLEDCTHSFGGTYDGVSNGLTCDAAIYSTQWNKPFSTGLGGILIYKSAEINEKVSELAVDLIEPSVRDRLLLLLQLIFRRYFLTEKNYWIMVRLFRFLTRKGIVVGSSENIEIETVGMPDGYFKNMSDVQAKAGLKNILQLSSVIKERKIAAAAYTEFLSNQRKSHVPISLFGNHCFLKYPLLTNNREYFKKKAEEWKIPLGDWFASPLHPVEGSLESWSFTRSDYPVADSVSQSIVNLPTSGVDVQRVIEFLVAHLDLIRAQEELDIGEGINSGALSGRSV